MNIYQLIVCIGTGFMMLLKVKSVFLGLARILTGLAAGSSLLLSGVVFAAAANTTDDSVEKTKVSPRLYAKAGNTVITLDQYNQAFQRAVRDKFYHGKPPEGELEALRKTVADELIMRQLLLQEAARRGLKSDEVVIGKMIDKSLEQYDQRYAGSEKWKQQRKEFAVLLRKTLSENDILEQMENRVRNVAPPTDGQLKKYYQDNQQLFTEPMQENLFLILLRVDPSSSKDVWDAALKKGESLVKELVEGADFAELARLHSADVSAAKGGEMGYVHRDMLGEAAQLAVDALNIGDTSKAVEVLEGVAIMRLIDRKPAQLRTFNDVKERARALWLRDEVASAWVSFKEKLRSGASVIVYD